MVMWNESRQWESKCKAHEGNRFHSCIYGPQLHYIARNEGYSSSSLTGRCTHFAYCSCGAEAIYIYIYMLCAASTVSEHMGRNFLGFIRHIIAPKFPGLPLEAQSCVGRYDSKPYFSPCSNFAHRYLNPQGCKPHSDEMRCWYPYFRACASSRVLFTFVYDEILKISLQVPHTHELPMR